MLTSKNVRDIFVVPTGYSYMSADLSQIEVAVLAALSRDEAMINDVREGIDFHSKILCKTLKKDYNKFMEELPTSPHLQSMRKNIKEVRFQLQYGATSRSISRTTGLTQQAVNAIIKAEQEEYPDVSKYYDKLFNEIKLNRRLNNNGKLQASHITLPTGRQIRFEAPIHTTWSRPQVLNYPIQGMAAELLKVWLVCINRVFKGIEYAEPKLTVHDDILFLTKDEHIEDTARLIELSAHKINVYLKNKFNIDWPVPIRGEIKVGPSWGSLSHHSNF